MCPNILRNHKTNWPFIYSFPSSVSKQIFITILMLTRHKINCSLFYVSVSKHFLQCCGCWQRKTLAVRGLKGCCECCVASEDQDNTVFPGSVTWLMCLSVESWQEGTHIAFSFCRNRQGFSVLPQKILQKKIKEYLQGSQSFMFLSHNAYDDLFISTLHEAWSFFFFFFLYCFYPQNIIEKSRKYLQAKFSYF